MLSESQEIARESQQRGAADLTDRVRLKRLRGLARRRSRSLASSRLCSGSLSVLLGANMSSSENIGPGVVLKLAKELRSLSQSPPDGVKIVMNEDEVTDIAADITGPSCTAFDGGGAALLSKPPHTLPY